MKTKYQITTKQFQANAVSHNGKIIKAAPALRHCVGYPTKWLEQYGKMHGWVIKRSPMLPSDPENG